MFGFDKLEVYLSNTTLHVDGGAICLGVATVLEELLGRLFLATVFLVLDHCPTVRPL